MINDARLSNDAPGGTAVVTLQSGGSLDTERRQINTGHPHIQTDRQSTYPMYSGQLILRVDQVGLVDPGMVNIMHHGSHESC